MRVRKRIERLEEQAQTEAALVREIEALLALLPEEEAARIVEEVAAEIARRTARPSSSETVP